MSVRSLNKVQLIGNLTRDPNLRFTPNNTAVCSFGLATNRSWTTQDTGEKQERTDFHNVVAWSKLAEICGNLLHKGDKVYVEGRIQTRDWKTQEGDERRITEIVIDDMILLNSKFSGGGSNYSDDSNNAAVTDPQANSQDDVIDEEVEKSSSAKGRSRSAGKKEAEAEDTDVSDDIPF